MAMTAGDREYYRLYFQEPGVAEADLERNFRDSMLGILYSLSGDIVADAVHQEGWDGHFPKGQTLSEQLVVPEQLPALYMYGKYDLIAGNTPEAIQTLQESLPDLGGRVKFKGAGHWLQQERAEQVNEALLTFLSEL